VSFVMNPLVGLPCEGAPALHASVQVKFASQVTQPDIPLTYSGTGPSPHSNVVLASGSLTVTQTCPTGGATPPPVIVAIKNIGNGIAYPFFETNGWVAGGVWASSSTAYDPANPAVTTWIYPNETWTISILPSPLVQCGSTYYFYIHINSTQGVESTMTVADTFK